MAACRLTIREFYMYNFSAFILLVSSVLISLTSCRDDFSLEADYQDVPVIYAYLDPGEAVQYVRVERALQGQGGDAGAVAADPDKLFYGSEAATVTLTNNQTNQSAVLDRINGSDFGLDRENGVFATDPNILYRLGEGELPLAAGAEITLIVSRPGAPDAVATTTILPAIQIVRPATTARIDDYRRPLLIGVEAQPAAAVFSVEFIFHIREFYASDPDRDRTVDLTYVADPSYRPDGENRAPNQVRFEVDNEAIYRFIGNNLPRVDGVVRRFDDFDLRITAAGEEVARLLTLENANAGLTSAQATPRYSNVLNGEGIVTSRTAAVRPGIMLDDASQDSLRDGSYTRGLNFR